MQQQEGPREGICLSPHEPPELPINDEARNEAHTARIGVRRY